MAHRLVLAAILAAGALLTGSMAQAADVQATAPYSDQRVGKYFQTGADSIFYQISGHGPAVLLVHGFPLSGALFQGQVAALSQSHTVIVPDLPGFGKSTTGTTAQTEQRYASDLFFLLDALGVKQAIIGGHSMGGQVALEMYREQPTRFRGMILFDTNPAPASIVEQAQWPAYGVQAKKLGSASIAPSVVGVMITGSTLMSYPGQGTIITGIVSQATPNGVIGGGHALATRLDYQAMLGSIRVPTLVMVGLDDTVYPFPVSQKLKAAIPGATLAIIPSVAHASMFQWAAYANGAIFSWLRGSGLN